MKAGWTTAALGEVAEIVSGATPKTAVASYWDGDIAWATPKDLSELNSKFIDSTPRKLSESGLKSCAARVLPAGSVLLSSRAPIGLVAINTAPMATNQGFKSLVPDEGRLDASYLYWWLVTNRSFLQSLGRGATFAEINKATTERIEIPLPPLPEQRRIAAILDKADELRAKRRASLALLDSLTEAIFLDMFGDPVTNPMAWPLVPLGEIASFYAGGTLPSGRPWEGEGGGYFLLKVSDLNLPGNERDLVHAQAWRVDPGSRSATCPAGAIVIPKRGGAIGTNKKRLTTRPSILDPNLMGIAPDPQRAEIQWMYRWFESFDLMKLVSGSSVPQLNKRDLAPLVIALPPVELQARYGQAAVKIGANRNKYAQSLAQLDGLFASLQQGAFAGQL